MALPGRRRRATSGPTDAETSTARPPAVAPKASGSIFSGAMLLGIGRYANGAVGFVGTVVIVRQLTQSDYGKFAFVLSVMAIVGFVADLKLSREVLVSLFGDEEDVIASYVGLRLAVGLVSYGLLVVVVVAGPYPEVVVTASLVGGVTLILLSVANAVRLLFEARLWMRSLAAAQFFGVVAQLVVILGLAAAGAATVVTLMWAIVANAAVTLLSLVLVARGHTVLRPRVQGARWKVWLREAAPLSVGVVLDTVYYKVDMVMLSLIGTFAATGIYSVGYKFADLLGSAVPWAVMTPTLTVLVRAWPGDRDLFHRTFRHSFVLVTVAGIMASVGFALIASPVIRIVYEERFAPATTPAILLVIGTALHFYTALFITTLIAVKRNVLYPLAAFFGLIVNIALNLVLIPRYSYNGAATATVITEAAVLILLVPVVVRIESVRPLPVGPMAKTAAAGAAMWVAGTLLGLVSPWPVAGLVAGLVFLGILHFSRVNGEGGLRALVDRGAVSGVTGPDAIPVVTEPVAVPPT